MIVPGIVCQHQLASLSRIKKPVRSLNLTKLQEQIDRLERPGVAKAEPDDALTLGVAVIDKHLPWGGLAPASLHSISCVDNFTPALGFAAVLLGRAARFGKKQTVLWCQREQDLYAPGLAMFGLNSDNLIVVNAARDYDLFWTMEEGLRSGALAAVFGVLGGIKSNSLRRLQLAAEIGGTTALIFSDQITNKDKKNYISSMGTSMTHWQVSNATTQSIEHSFFSELSRWQLELLRCRGGKTGSWLVDWGEMIWTKSSAKIEQKTNKKDGYINDNMGSTSVSQQEASSPGRLRLAQSLRDGSNPSFTDANHYNIAIK